MKEVVCATCLIFLTVSASLPQSSNDPPAFDVASIKRSDPAITRADYGISPAGSFFAKGVTTRLLIENSYDIRNFQLSGEPSWVDTERYDIETQVEDGVPEDDARRATTAGRQILWDQLMAKVRLLLADRFRLKLHRETKQASVYALVVARTGSRLHAPRQGEASFFNIGKDDRGNTVITATRIPLSSLVRYLGGQTGRLIFDETELKDDYDFVLTFSTDLTRQPELSSLGTDHLPAGSDGPSVFTALQEQLGLRLATQKRTVEALVVDYVQKPSEN